jgi:hypothetical protein
MKQINVNNKPISELLRKNSRSKANAVFQKLLARNQAKPNPFDKTRETISPIIKDIKPGAEDV